MERQTEKDILRTPAETSAVSLKRLQRIDLRFRLVTALCYLRDLAAYLRAPRCEHKNTHQPLAYLTKCWDCGATQRLGGPWTLGGAR